MYNKKVAPVVDLDISVIDDREVYLYYLNVNPDTSRSYYSPFKSEKTPSFRFYYKNNILMFKDFSSGKHGNSIELVKQLYGLESKQAIKKILTDVYRDKGSLKVQTTDISSPKIYGVSSYKRKNEEDSLIEVIPRSWLLEDIIYWGNYGLNLSDLTRYDVAPCKEVWIDKQWMWYSYTKNSPCYRYIVGNKYKCYQPFSISKRNKWISNCRIKNIQGLKQLPEKGELLVITKSLKDIMVLNKFARFNCIALNAESITITEEMSNYFYSRFDNVVMFYDNDEAGIKNMIRNEGISGIPYIHLPTHFLKEGIKDPSDLFKKRGKKVFLEEINKLISL